MGHRFIWFACCLAMSSFAWGQEFNAIFEIDGPITHDCERQFPIEHVARVVIFHDFDQNGRSEGDFPLCWGTCIPEESWGGPYEFYADSASGVVSPHYFAYLQYGDLPNFYLCLYPWPGEEIEWVSPNFTLTPHDYSNPEAVSLPLEQWTCGGPQFSHPSCTATPSYVRVNNAEPWPEPIVTLVCPSSFFSIRVVDSLGINTPYRLPTIQVQPDSSDGLPANAELNLGGLWWNDWFGYVPRYDGRAYGYVEVSFLDSPPCGTVDTFTVQREGMSVWIRWNTLAETNLSHFEIWRDHAIGYSWLRHVADVHAVDSLGGAQYEFLDEDYFEPYLWYTLVLVANDSLRYADMRAYLPWDTDADEPPSVASSPRLIGNYPNPFNSETRIEFELPSESSVALEVYDLAGRLVNTMLNAKMPAGEHAVSFRGDNLASGLYFVRLTSGSFQSTHKMILLK